MFIWDQKLGDLLFESIMSVLGNGKDKVCSCA